MGEESLWPAGIKSNCQAGHLLWQDSPCLEQRRVFPRLGASCGQITLAGAIWTPGVSVGGGEECQAYRRRVFPNLGACLDYYSYISLKIG